MLKEKNGSKQLIENILTSGTYDALDIGKRSRLVFLNSIMLSGIVLLVVFGIIGVTDSDFSKRVIGYSVFSVAFIVAIFFIFLRIRKSYTLGNYFISILMFLFFGYLTVTGGSDSSGVLWMQSYSLICIFLLGDKTGLTISLLFLAGTGSCIFLNWPVDIGYTLAFKIRVVGVYIFITIFSLTFERIRKLTQERIEQSKNDLTITTQKLLDAKIETDSIMESVNEGIFLLDGNLKIGSEYSKYLETIFNQSELQNESFIDCIAPGMGQKDVQAAKDYLEMFFDEKVNKQLLKEINPIDKTTLSLQIPEGGFEEKHLEFRFDAISLKGAGKMILGTVSDITEAVNLSEQLKEESSRNTRKMETIFQIIQINPELMKDFLEDTDKELLHINKLLKAKKTDNIQLMENIFQSVHAIKGNAVLIGLKKFGEKIHKIEDKISTLCEKSSIVWNDLLQITIDLSTIQADIDEIKSLIQEIMIFRSKLDDSTKEDLVLQTIKRTIKKVGEETGKDVVLDSSGFIITDIPHVHKKTLKDVLIQLTRNSIFHGIEDSAVRKANGKNPQGLISISSEKTKDRFNIIFKDDGQGLSLEKIKEKAKKHKKLCHLDFTKLPPGRILSLIFQPGFSTSDGSTLSAGRGVGMNLIKSRIEANGGTLKVKSIPGKSCIFELGFPY